MENPFRYFEDLAAELPEISSDSIVSRTLYDDDQHKVYSVWICSRSRTIRTHRVDDRAVVFHPRPGQVDPG